MDMPLLVRAREEITVDGRQGKKGAVPSPVPMEINQIKQNSRREGRGGGRAKPNPAKPKVDEEEGGVLLLQPGGPLQERLLEEEEG